MVENLFKNTWLPSFSGRQGRHVDKKYLEMIDSYAFSIDSLSNFQHKEICVEIGFGSGELLASEALIHPETLFIGCELYLCGISKLIKKIEEFNIENIKIFRGDGRNLLLDLSDGIVNTIFLLFPDPWPKRRHHKRRIVNQEFLNLSLKKLNKGGKMVIATDHDDYFIAIAQELKNNFDGHYMFYDDLAGLFATCTKYQNKSKKRVGYFLLQKN